LIGRILKKIEPEHRCWQIECWGGQICDKIRGSYVLFSAE